MTVNTLQLVLKIALVILLLPAWRRCYLSLRAFNVHRSWLRRRRMMMQRSLSICL
jgi:hypothetical protein